SGILTFSTGDAPLPDNVSDGRSLTSPLFSISPGSATDLYSLSPFVLISAPLADDFRPGAPALASVSCGLGLYVPSVFCKPSLYHSNDHCGPVSPIINKKIRE